MDQFNPFSIPTAVVLATTWWFTVYFFSRNPYSNKIRALCLATFLISFYALLGVLQSNLKGSDQHYVLVQRVFIWAIAFPAPAWFYFSVRMLPKDLRSNMKPFVVVGFLSGAVIAFLGAFTNLIYDYSNISLTKSSAIYLIAPGKLIWLLSVQIIFFLFLATFNFFRSALKSKETRKRQGFYTLTAASLVIFFGGVYLTSNVFLGNVTPETPGEILLLFGLILAIFAIIWYSLDLGMGVMLWGREFVLITIEVLVLYAVFGSVYLFIQFPYSFKLLLLIIAGLMLIPVTQVGHDWFSSFVRNIVYQKKLAIPKVTDGEVTTALRNYNHPETLEESSFLRLNLLNKMEDEEGLDRITSLKKLLKTAIDYLKPDNVESRNKPNLKYQMLKLISEQAEEGQILWDLGFGEYPLEIAEKLEGDQPRFAINHPTDYQAISRNAFISLKKEAIHDLAWRISYLEKTNK